MKKNNPQGESIRIRLTYQLERKLIAEKNRTGKSVSQITREALEQYFRRRWAKRRLNFSQKNKKEVFICQKNTVNALMNFVRIESR